MYDINMMSLNVPSLLFRNLKDSDIILPYDDYIDKVRDLVRNLRKNKSDLECAMMISWILKNGYFSFDNKFELSTNVGYEVKSHPGINVVSGKGCCRHLACFYRDIFEGEYDYNLLYNCSISKHTWLSILPLGNHIINLVMHNGVLYGYDLTNHCYIFKNEKILSDIEKSGYKIKYKYLSDVIFSNLVGTDKIDMEELKRILEKPNNMMTKEDFIKLKEDINKYMIRNEKIVQEFSLDSKELKDKIKEKILER